jgi:hypothetical protein
LNEFAPPRQLNRSVASYPVKRTSMEWHQLAFPDDVDPLDEPNALIREAKGIYQKTGFPKDFCVFQEINHESSCVIYFSPMATRHCREDGLFATYRKVHPCKKPERSGKPIITVVGDDDSCQTML